MTLPAATSVLSSTRGSAAPRMARPLWRAALELAITGLLLWATLRMIDVSSIARRLARLDPLWFACGVGTAAPQLLGAALRWRFTAARLGTRISLGHALREYYVASLFNQVLPSGIAGDALRVARHGSMLSAGRSGYMLSLRAVAFERFAGQLVLGLCVASTVPLWGGPRSSWVGLAVVPLSIAILWGLARRARARDTGHPARGVLATALADADDALFRRGAFLVQFLTSALVLSSCVAMFACSARALGAPLHFHSLLRIAPLVLAAMSMPLSFAGWGLREAATTALYAASGLDAGLGMSVAMTYGLMSLLGSLPGLYLWLRRDRGTDDRRT